MSKKEKRNDEPVTRGQVQRMIEAAIIRSEMLHGHLGADDAAKLLEELERDED